jgi:hypothetical protein
LRRAVEQNPEFAELLTLVTDQADAMWRIRRDYAEYKASQEKIENTLLEALDDTKPDKPKVN